MTNILVWLQGKKTYGLGVIGVLVFISARLGWITSEVEVNIYEALGIAGLFTIRAAIKKIE